MTSQRWLMMSRGCATSSASRLKPAAYRAAISVGYLAASSIPIMPPRLWPTTTGFLSTSTLVAIILGTVAVLLLSPSTVDNRPAVTALLCCSGVGSCCGRPPSSAVYSARLKSAPCYFSAWCSRSLLLVAEWKRVEPALHFERWPAIGIRWPAAGPVLLSSVSGRRIRLPRYE
jgi:hypothetical protein